MPWGHEPSRWRFRGASELWSGQFADRLGNLVAGARSTTGVLLEWRSDVDGVILAAPAASGSALIRSAADGLDGRLTPLDDLPGPSADGPIRLGVFEGPSPSADGTGEDRAPPNVPVPRLVGPRRRLLGTWAVQLHVWPARGEASLSGSLRTGVRGGPSDGLATEAELVDRLAERLRRSGVRATFRPVAPHPWCRREWNQGALRRFRATRPLRLAPPALGPLARFAAPPAEPEIASAPQHTIVLGASGAGKTSLLARLGAEAVLAGRPVVAVDVHGDLGPALVARLPPEARARVIAVDAGEPTLAVPGVDVLAPANAGAAPRIVAALRRSSEDGGAVYWGFRLERIFDHFVRLAIEENGNLEDLYDLLTSEPRREAARLATEDLAQARFLDELHGILRRNPEFLWPAAARLAKVVLQRPVARVVAPGDAALPLEELLADGRSVIFRLPLGALGPEGAQLAATLVLGRVYFGRTAHGPGRARPILLLVDEAQTVAASLLAEILADGRKFGIRAIVATQYPGRLEGPLRDAAAGAASTHVVLRTPRAGAPSVAPWVGLSAPEGVEWLPQLSDGAALVSSSFDEQAVLRAPGLPGGASTDDAWSERVHATAREFGGSTLGGPAPEGSEEILFRLRGRELARRSTAIADLTAEEDRPREGLERELRRMARRGWVTERPDGQWGVDEAGRAFLGEIPDTGAVRESVEHRALLGATFRIFARRGERLEVLRQGRFDTRLPDARWRVLDPAVRQGPPAQLADRLRDRQRSWGWRAFGGRDVYVEAEVSGADRRARLLRDLAKADAAGAHCLFVVGDPGRGARVRNLLVARDVDRSRATVWVLGPAVRAGPRP
ncbi:MAG TPA: hypothetical protein VMH90_06220 [Thermoplasmata archaeon]|nr:hypothetical protein [Thermoplasmata archaeon]